MKGYIVYQTYRIINGNPFVFLFGRLENGQNFVTLNYYKPYFYIKEKDLEKALTLKDFEYEKTDFKTINGDKVVKIYTKIPKDVSKFRREFEKNGIECYEADIKFSQRFLIDKGIKRCIEIDGEYNSEGIFDRVYREPSIKPTKFLPKLKVLSIDIETNSDANEIYCIALVTDNFKKVLIKDTKMHKNAISFPTEEELLEAFKEKILELDPDIITGWNVIDFDLKFLQKKFKEYNMSFTLGRDRAQCKLRIESSFLRSSKADFPGRIVIDAIELLKISYIKLESYRLDDVAEKILGRGKLVKKLNLHKEIDELYRKDKQKLIEYNLNDAELVFELIKKTKVLELSIYRSLLSGIQLDKIGSSIANFDSLYLRKLRNRKLVAKCRNYRLKEEQIKGGFVKEPKPGIYDFILVLDFKSLYPSIIRTFNIDPITLVQKGRNVIKAPNGALFRKEKGILPEILGELWKERAKAKAERDELASHAIKILMNSFFGVLANPNCRFYSLKTANAITGFGQHIIKLTAKKIEQLGYDVIYMDTDSCFVVSNAKNKKEADDTGKKISSYINKFYKDYVKKNYGVTSYLELEYDKCFVRFLMPKLRSGERGAKKRYAGIVIEDGKEKLEFTGLEFVRGDWTDLAKKFQFELLDRIFHNKEITKFIKKFVSNLLDGKYDELLIYRKSIRKELDEYVATTPPHVKAARKLEKLESKLIEYVMTERGPEPVSNIKHRIDYKHYIEKQIKPIADSLLVFFGKNFDDIMKGKQTTLKRFK